MYLNRFSVRINGKGEDSGYVEMRHSETYTIVLKNDHDVRCDATVEIDGKDVGTFRIEAHSNLHLERPVNEQKRFTFYRLGSSEADKSGLNKVEKNDMGLIKVIFKPEKKREVVENVVHHYHHSYLPWESNLYQNTYVNNTYRGRKMGSLDVTLSEGKSLSSTSETLRGYNASASGWASYDMNDSLGEMQCVSNSYDEGPCAGGTGLSGYSGQRFMTVADLDYDTERITEINLRLIPIKEQRRDPVELKPVVKSTPVPPPLFVLV